MLNWAFHRPKVVVSDPWVFVCLNSAVVLLRITTNLDWSVISGDAIRALRFRRRSKHPHINRRICQSSDTRWEKPRALWHPFSSSLATLELDDQPKFYAIKEQLIFMLPNTNFVSRNVEERIQIDGILFLAALWSLAPSGLLSTRCDVANTKVDARCARLNRVSLESEREEKIEDERCWFLCLMGWILGVSIELGEEKTRNNLFLRFVQVTWCSASEERECICREVFHSFHRLTTTTTTSHSLASIYVAVVHYRSSTVTLVFLPLSGVHLY